MLRLRLLAFFVALTIGTATALNIASGPNSTCITWYHVCNHDPIPSNYILAGNQQIRFGPPKDTWQELSCLPNSNASNTFGHRDYGNGVPDPKFPGCWHPPQVSDLCMVVALPNAVSSLSWILVQLGSPVPCNAVLSADGTTAMARSLASNTNYGNVMPGYAAILNKSTFGTLYFEDYGGHIANDFEVAICSGTPCPTSPPQPPPPSKNLPYIRFGHTVPTEEAVDCVITQGTVSYTWTEYQFGRFSEWIQVFGVGNAKIDIYHNVNGQRQALLVSVTRLLTPGPLVVVIKDYWPVSVDSNVETIAASYVPPAAGMSGARLFNLSPDTQTAGMMYNNYIIVPDGISYSTGSPWMPIGPDSATFDVFSGSKDPLANLTLAPPSGGAVFTAFLIGVQNTTFPTGVQPQIVALIDAPEG